MAQARKSTLDSPIQSVQLDGLVLDIGDYGILQAKRKELQINQKRSKMNARTSESTIISSTATTTTTAISTATTTTTATSTATTTTTATATSAITTNTSTTIIPLVTCTTNAPSIVTPTTITSVPSATNVVTAAPATRAKLPTCNRKKVALKIIKHCQEEGAGGTDMVQGALLGLVVENRLEITNCFPFPRHIEDEDFEEVNTYQMEMMRHLRHVNVDYWHVGWYQSTCFGSFINKPLLESQFTYQHSIEESVVLIYDPLKTTQGFLSIKAYRLGPEMMTFYEEGDFTTDGITNQKISFDKMFEEIPVNIKNSHLVNALLCEIDDMTKSSKQYNLLNLATSSMLEKNMRQLMECVDETAMDTNKFLSYQRQHLKQQQAKQQHVQKRQLENSQRQAKGEPPLPEEDINKLFKPIPAPPRLDSLLIAGQIDNYCTQVSDFVSQSFGKLFIAESLHEVQKPV